MMVRKMYEDKRGWQYLVFSGIGGNTYKARYRQPGKTSWKCVARLPWRDTIAEAQEDLDRMAERKGWREV